MAYNERIGSNSSPNPNPSPNPTQARPTSAPRWRSSSTAATLRSTVTRRRYHVLHGEHAAYYYLLSEEVSSRGYL
eukprot:scaffold116479_cov45-Phaeocystis_antarctica.AAC.1